MEVNNKVTPSEAQMQGFLEQGHDEPIYMLNLLKFKERAEYEDGRDSDLTGEQAYGIYGQAVADLLVKVGGAPVFSASVERLMLGEVEDLWDSAAPACISPVISVPDDQLKLPERGTFLIFARLPPLSSNVFE